MDKDRKADRSPQPRQPKTPCDPIAETVEAAQRQAMTCGLREDDADAVALDAVMAALVIRDGLIGDEGGHRYWLAMLVLTLVRAEIQERHGTGESNGEGGGHT